MLVAARRRRRRRLAPSLVLFCLFSQPKTPPQPASQFTKEQGAKLEEGRTPVCYFCKGDVDDADTVQGAFIRVRQGLYT